MAISTVTLTLNGQNYNLTYDSQNEVYKATITAPSTSSYGQTGHTYNGVVTVTDSAGNTATATKDDFSSLALRVKESVKPVITPVSPSSGATITVSTPTIVWDVTDSGSGVDTSTITLSAGSRTYTTLSSPAITTTPISNGYRCQLAISSPLSDGQTTLTYNANDHDDNSANQVQVTVTVNTVAAELNVSFPPDNYTTNQSSITITGTTDGNSVKVNGNNATLTGGSFSYTMTLTEGSNTITIVANNSAGNSTTVSRVVLLDSTPPIISNITITENPVGAGQTFLITVTVYDT